MIELVKNLTFTGTTEGNMSFEKYEKEWEEFKNSRKIYAVSLTIPYEGCYLESIHRTYEGAFKAVGKLIKPNQHTKNDYESEDYKYGIFDGWGEGYIIEERDLEE